MATGPFYKKFKWRGRTFALRKIPYQLFHFSSLSVLILVSQTGLRAAAGLRHEGQFGLLRLRLPARQPLGHIPSVRPLYRSPRVVDLSFLQEKVLLGKRLPLAARQLRLTLSLLASLEACRPTPLLLRAFVRPGPRLPSKDNITVIF